MISDRIHAEPSGAGPALSPPSRPQVQFVLTITHTLSAVVRPCGFPFGCLIFQSSYMLTLVILFLNFYVQVSQRETFKGERARTVHFRTVYFTR